VALASVHQPPLFRFLALMGAGVGMFLAMIGDCLDGMHARRTSQCSRLGEMMDHWLDAIIVPLATIGMTYALQMQPWAIVAVNVTAAMIYHGQLVLYHHTGRFIHPEPTNGVEAQFGSSLGYVGIGVLFYFTPRDQPWLDMTIAGIALLGIFVQMRCNWFYYVRLGRRIDRHLIFVAMCGALGALYLVGAIDAYAFGCALVFTSFRISGSYVLFTILGRRYGGSDLGIAAFLVAAGAAHALRPGALLDAGAFTLSAAEVVVYVACTYMLARNMIDFARHYDKLKPSAR
jgi:phosphatidylglycerophosphate synthase